MTDRWWKLLEDNWNDVFKLINDYHPSEPRSLRKHQITARRAEEARNRLIKDVKRPDPSGQATEAKIKKDSKTMYNIIVETYHGLPESKSVRSLPGFFVLCDLISDYYE